MTAPTQPASARQRLVLAGAGLFYAHGYHAVGVNELCRAAEVRKGSFYHFFESKEALACAAVEQNRRSVERDVLQPAFAPDVGPAERIVRYFELLARANEAGDEDARHTLLGCPFGNLSAEIGAGEPALREAVNHAFDLIRRYIRGCLTDAVADGADLDPDQGAQALLAYMEGVLVLARASGDPDDIRRLGVLAPRVAGLS